MVSAMFPEESDDVQLTLLRAACDNAVDMIVIVDSHGKIQFANDAVTTILGYEPSELIGTTMDAFIHEDHWPEIYDLRERLRRGEIGNYISDRIYLAKDGTPVPVTSALTVVSLGEDKKPYVVCFVRDMRKEREASKKLQKALVAAEEATRLKSEFLANMSHEIRTPLNGVFGMAQALDNSSLTSEQKEYVDILIDSGKTLLTLLNDILDLSKIEAGKLDISVVEADLRHKLGRICAVHETVAREKGLDFQTVISPSVPARLMFDPIRFRQCVDNLMSNAIKFTGEGHVCLAVTSEPCGGDEHVISVAISDTGDGVPQEKQEQIFSAFQQADASTSRVYGGTGLGLPICRKLAGLMGGDLTLKSTPGEGSTFTLTIRAKAAAGEATVDGKPLPTIAAEPETPVLPENLKVLVADDNDVNLRVVDLFLKKHGVAMTHARDGEEVLARLADGGPFDLILMDIQMPKMDGVEAFRAIRSSSEAWRDIPVIALTADAMSNDRDKYLDIGMQGYIPKPVSQRDLIAELAQVSAGAPAPQALGAAKAAAKA